MCDALAAGACTQAWHLARSERVLRVWSRRWGNVHAAEHDGHSREHTTPWLINGDDTTVPPDIGPAADIDIGPEAGPE